MIRFDNIAYVAFVLAILLSSAPIASASQASEPVTYRAELAPFPESLTWKQRNPARGWPHRCRFRSNCQPRHHNCRGLR